MNTYLILGPCIVTNRACPTPNKATGAIAKYYGLPPGILSEIIVIEKCTMKIMRVALNINTS